MIRSVRTALARASSWLSPGVAFEPKDDARHCARCGYRFEGGMHGSPSPCSECGTFIDPSMPDAFRRAGPHWIVRGLMRAPGLPTLVALLGICALYLHGISAPGARFDSLVLALLLGGLIVVVVAVRAAVAFVIGLWQRCSARVWRQTGWWALVAVVGAVALLAWAKVPRRVLFLVDRPQLAALAGQWQSDPRSCTTPQDARLAVPLVDGRPMAVRDFTQFEWCARDTDPDAWLGFVVFIRNSGFLDTRGAYLYLPALPAGIAEQCGLMPHADGWYSAELSM